jgi:hypothetical protein
MRRDKYIGLGLGNNATIDLNDSTVRAFKSGDAAQGSGFSAAAWPEQSHKLTVCDIEGNAMHNRSLTIYFDEITNADTHSDSIQLSSVI